MVNLNSDQLEDSEEEEESSRATSWELREQERVDEVTFCSETRFIYTQSLGPMLIEALVLQSEYLFLYG